MQSTTDTLKEAQNSFEHRFNCLICLCPKLRNIYGTCQHRLCEECLYDTCGNRKENLSRCPVCQKPEAFPVTRPDIPEDNVEMMKCLGVRVCTSSGCEAEMWEWELESHVAQCHRAQAKTKTQVLSKDQDDLYEDKSGPQTRRKSKEAQTVRRRRSARIRLTDISRYMQR